MLGFLKKKKKKLVNLFSFLFFSKPVILKLKEVKNKQRQRQHIISAIDENYTYINNSS